MPKDFHDLTERELLALAISLEEEDERIYASLADRLRPDSEATADILDRMREEESQHRRRLIEQYRQRFGDHIPLIRRQDVRGFVNRRPLWLSRVLNFKQIRDLVTSIENETTRFYHRAAQRATAPEIRQLLNDLAIEEARHSDLERALKEEKERTGALAEEEQGQRRRFVLQIIQPGLAGLMDGSVSTLAPLFAAAFATHSTWATFLVGIAASVGAGISMGFAEALSDDGQLSGRGHPLLRGTVCGIMTTVGGLGHTIPYLIPNFLLATGVAIVVVVLELIAIAWIRHHYMDTPLTSAVLQVVLGGVLVFIAGIAIGSA
jgi:rubrerythrin